MLKRIPIYLAAFVFPPIMIGLVSAISTVSQVMIQKTVPPVAGAPTGAPSGVTAAPAPAAGHKLRALFVLSNQGVQVTDTLGAAEVLGESELFDLVMTAEKKDLVPMTGAQGGAIQPGVTFSDAPEADLLVVPAVLDPDNDALTAFVRERAPKARLVLCLGEGARLLARAGLLQGRAAVTHFLAVKALRQQEPKTQWLQGPRYVEDGKFITSAGSAASVDAAFFAVSRLGSPETARQAAHSLGYAWHEERDPSGKEAREATGHETEQALKSLAPQDYLELFLHGGYDWNKDEVAVLLFPGVSELGVAAALDVFPRTFKTHAFTVSPERKLIPSRHGLLLVASTSVADAAHPDLMVIPSGVQPGGLKPTFDPLAEESINRWVSSQNILVKSALYDAPGKAFDRDLELVSELLSPDEAEARRKGRTPALTQFVAKMIEYPIEVKGPAISLSTLWLRPLGIGLLGILLAWLIDLRIRGKLR